MARWCTLTSLLLIALGLPRSGAAQTYPNSGPPPGWEDPGVTHVGHKTKQRAVGPLGPLPAGPGRTIYEQLPDDQGWLYDDTPLERALKETFRHAYFRVDYLNWNVTRPGDNLIGSDTAIISAEDLDLNDPTINSVAYPNQALVPDSDPYIFQPFRDPLTAFQISNPIDQNQSLIAVVQPSLKDVRIDSNNGIRGTFGLPVGTWGTFEGSIFALQTSTSPILRSAVKQYDVYDSNGDGIFGDNFVFDPTRGEFDRNGNGLITDVVSDFQAFAIPILIDMQVPQPGFIDLDPDPDVFDPQLPPVTSPLSPGTELNPETPDPNDTRVIPGRGDNFRIVWAIRDPNTANPDQYISTYTASLKTAIWGTEGNFLLPTKDEGSPLSLRPMLGFRYFRFAEDFRQSGAYEFPVVTPGTGVVVPTIVNRKIDATTINNLYGPQIGLRGELASRWVTIGAQPKVMLGLNTYKANLETENVLSPTDLDQFLRENESTFGVVGDFETYVRLHVTKHLSFHVGYNLMWAGMLTRPADNIIYNARTVSTANPNGTENFSLESDFKLDVDYTGVMLQGLNIGGQVSY